MHPHIGLVGCGRWGSKILHELVQLGCRVSVADIEPECRSAASRAGAQSVVSVATELPDVQGAIVATTTIAHGQVTENLLSRKIPIFVEKPLTNDLVTAQRLLELDSKQLFVMDKWRYHPGIEMLADIARKQELGPVVGLHTERLQWGNNHSDIDGVWLLAPHNLSMAMEIFGRIPEPRYAIAEKAGDEVVSMNAILGDEPWFTMSISTRHHRWSREVRLHCRDGVAVLKDAYSEHLEIFRYAHGGVDPPAPELRVIEGESPLVRELNAFVSYLGGGSAPRSSAAEGLQAVDTISRLRKLAGV